MSRWFWFHTVKWGHCLQKKITSPTGLEQTHTQIHSHTYIYFTYLQLDITAQKNEMIHFDINLYGHLAFLSTGLFYMYMVSEIWVVS